MGLDSEKRRQDYRQLRHSILKSYFDALRAERGGVSDPLIAAQALIDFQDLGIPLLKQTPALSEDPDDNMPAEYKGFRYYPLLHHVESQYHPDPLHFTPTELSIMARFIRAKGSVIPNISFLSPEDGQVLSDENRRVVIKDLRLKLDDREIHLAKRKTRRFIHTVHRTGYRFDPIEFRSS